MLIFCMICWYLKHVTQNIWVFLNSDLSVRVNCLLAHQQHLVILVGICMYRYLEQLCTTLTEQYVDMNAWNWLMYLCICSFVHLENVLHLYIVQH